jgi:hypothetical protein
MPSAKTTIDKRWIGVIISFARRQEGDFTLKKYEEAQDNPRIFADKATTFEVNPQFDPDHPFYRHFRWEVIDELNIRVPSPYADEFRTDPTESATKYLCQPPPQEHGFFEIPKKIDACVDKNRSLPVVTPDVITRYIDQGNDGEVSQRYLKVHLDGLPEREKDCEYYIHGDPALYTDDFVVSLAHKTPETMTLVDSDGNTKTVNGVVVDFIIVWKPRPGIPVDFLDIEEKILMLSKLYDVETVQRLFSAGIFSHDYSFSQSQQLAIYRNLNTLVHNDMISLPDDQTLIRELKFLKIKNGKIDHDIAGKDYADAVAAAVVLAIYSAGKKLRPIPASKKRESLQSNATTGQMATQGE